MRKYYIILPLILIALAISFETWAGSEACRFAFQKNAGDGALDLYRIDIDHSTSKGTLCFLNTERSDVPDKVTEQIKQSSLWTSSVEIKKYEHACFGFMLYEPFGWFYSPRVKYSEAEYVFFFIGEIEKKKIDGELYYFRDFKPEGDKMTYKTVHKATLAGNCVNVKK